MADETSPQLPVNNDWSKSDASLILKGITGEYVELRKLATDVPWFNFIPEAAGRRYNLGDAFAPPEDFYYYGFGYQFYGANLNPGAIVDFGTAAKKFTETVWGVFQGKEGTYDLHG